MGISFFDSRPDRKKRDPNRTRSFTSSPIPPAKFYTLLSLDDIYNSADRTLVFDSESYVNYFLVGFKCVETDKAILFEDSPVSYIDTQALSYVLHRFRVVGFNSASYDLPLIQLAMQGERAARLHQVGMEIINQGLRPIDVQRAYKLRRLRINHIDLIEVAPIQASLKIYAGRLHCQRMQDLPFDPHLELTQEQAAIVRDYNINDLDNTKLLLGHLRENIELREQLGAEYNDDFRSKSDAQIAEAIISSELDKERSFKLDAKDKPEIKPGFRFKYKTPDFMTFKTPQLQALLKRIQATEFEVGLTGHVELPDALSGLQITLGGCLYRLGIGGLHSSEVSAAHVATADTLIIDKDVASYYPAIILNQGLYPAHLGPGFLKVYQTIVNRRLKAKFDKVIHIAAGLKIATTATFGKTTNIYSRLYSPEMFIQIVIGGQLCLLMQIEAIELAGIPVISANTDGVVIKCPVNRYNDLETVVLLWEAITGFKTEETRYNALYCRDVNNYIAVKLKYDENLKVWTNEVDGCKTKGIYSDKGSAQSSVLSKNPENQIVSDAVQAFFAHNTPLADTIYGCLDVRKFVCVRTVKGGAEKNGVYLGKAIRWYYAQGETGTINYVLSGNKVPKSEGAKPLMELPPYLPADLDFSYYLKEAREALFDLGYFKRPASASLL